MHCLLLTVRNLVRQKCKLNIVSLHFNTLISQHLLQIRLDFITHALLEGISLRLRMLLLTHFEYFGRILSRVANLFLQRCQDSLADLISPLLNQHLLGAIVDDVTNVNDSFLLQNF